MRICTWKTIRNTITVIAVGGLLLNPLSAVGATRTKKSGATAPLCTEGTCSVATAAPATADRTLGTTVHWMESPDAASHAATAEGKLVFMIQVSGNFARQEFT